MASEYWVIKLSDEWLVSVDGMCTRWGNDVTLAQRFRSRDDANLMFDGVVIRGPWDPRPRIVRVVPKRGGGGR